jgi:hypothetical protein
MEKTIEMYDPTIDAYRQISIESAKKFVESAEKVKLLLEEIENATK